MDRDTNNLRESRRSVPQPRLLSPKGQTRFNSEKMELEHVSSEEISDNISADDSDSFTGSESSSLDGRKRRSATRIEHFMSSSSKGNKSLPKPKSLYSGPVIRGAFNNWQAQPLIKVEQLARVLDKRPPPNFLQECIENRKCRPALKDVKEMNKRERAYYQQRVERHQSSYINPEVWGPIISAYLRKSYKHSRIVGRENFEKLSPKNIQVTFASQPISCKSQNPMKCAIYPIYTQYSPSGIDNYIFSLFVPCAKVTP